jgi:hypothetical protein
MIDSVLRNYADNKKRWLSMLPNVKAVPLQAWGWPRGFQEFKVPRFLDNGTGWW